MGIGAAVKPDFATLRQRLPEIQSALRELDLDGWLLFDLHARNAVAATLLGQADMSRRYFVLIPAEGDPTALTHGIEQGPWEHWPWPSQSYVSWQQLDTLLSRHLAGKRVAMEAIDRDAVPAVDLVPWGVVELVRAAGADVVSSSRLITQFHASWSREQLDSHRRAARALADVARAAFQEAAKRVKAEGVAYEGDMRDWVMGALVEAGLAVDGDCIFASGVNAANPHYGIEERGAALRRGDVVLLDLWGKESEPMVYADQTWMAVLGPELPEVARPLWQAVRDARETAVTLLSERWESGRALQGYEVDDAVRALIAGRGYGDAFIHRTGHSIDREIHGSGPNIDNFETHEVRELAPGIAFSIEPGIYLPGTMGVRTEIDVYMGEDGPEVTTPDRQDEVFRLLPED